MSGPGRLAQLAAAAAREAGGGRVGVIGEGRLAQEIVAALGPQRAAAAEPPVAIIETCGDPAAIQDALEQVGDLGVVVLVGAPRVKTAALDLYRDLHGRGLTMIGISPGATATP